MRLRTHARPHDEDDVGDSVAFFRIAIHDGVFGTVGSDDVADGPWLDRQPNGRKTPHIERLRETMYQNCLALKCVSASPASSGPSCLLKVSERYRGAGWEIRLQHMLFRGHQTVIFWEIIQASLPSGNGTRNGLLDPIGGYDPLQVGSNPYFTVSRE